MMVNVACQKRRANLFPINSIAISFGPGRLASMKIGINFLHIEDPNRLGQDVIQRFAQVSKWNGRLNAYTGYLGQGMDPGISSPGTLW